MIKTGAEIKGDIRRMLAEWLQGRISGDVYLGEQGGSSLRPRDSQLEDAVVIFTAGESGQIQTGRVTVQLYFPDIDPWQTGVWTLDEERNAQLQGVLRDWVRLYLTASRSDYRFQLAQAIDTDKADGIRQHFVVLVLAYEYYDGED